MRVIPSLIYETEKPTRSHAWVLFAMLFMIFYFKTELLSAGTLLSAISTDRVVVVSVTIFVNHSFACCGAGWFSCLLEYFFERSKR